MNKTQKIKRTDLRYFFDNVCNTWKIEIANLLIEQTGSTIEIETNLIKKAYQEASSDMKLQLEKHFDIFSINKLFKVKNYTELCKIIGIKELTEKDFINSKNPEKTLAFEQIKTIEEVYNDGWKPNHANRSQEKYYPYFINENGSWRFDVSGCGYDCWSGSLGLYKDRETSDFVGKTFMNIYLKVI